MDIFIIEISNAEKVKTETLKKYQKKEISNEEKWKSIFVKMNKWLVTKGMWKDYKMFRKVAVEGIYPMHPLSTFMLTNLSDYLQKQKYYDAQTKQVDTTFFCKNFGGDWDESGLDDISVLGTIIPLDQTQIIELEDPFIVCQKILRQCGIKEGTPFDFKRVLLNYYYYSQLDKRKILEALKSSQTEWER